MISSKHSRGISCVKQMLVQGHNLRFPEQAGSQGISSTRDQKTRTVGTCLVSPGGLSLTSAKTTLFNWKPLAHTKKSKKKNCNISNPEMPPQYMEEMPKKYENSRLWQFSFFFWGGGPTLSGGFCMFFAYSRVQGFWTLYQARGGF